MTRTKKKDFDKFLTRLFAMQRATFKQGSSTALEVRPKYDEGAKDFCIYVCAYNDNKPTPSVDGSSKDVYYFQHFPLYAFVSVEENEKVMQKLTDYLDLGNGKH